MFTFYFDCIIVCTVNDIFMYSLICTCSINNIMNIIYIYFSISVKNVDNST